MTRSGNERITVRLSQNDVVGLKKVQASGDFEDMSTSVRWCIHFALAMLKQIPAAIISSFSETDAADIIEEKETKDDKMEVAPSKVHNHCNGNGGCQNGSCKEM